MDAGAAPGIIDSLADAKDAGYFIICVIGLVIAWLHLKESRRIEESFRNSIAENNKYFGEQMHNQTTAIDKLADAVSELGKIEGEIVHLREASEARLDKITDELRRERGPPPHGITAT